MRAIREMTVLEASEELGRERARIVDAGGTLEDLIDLARVIRRAVSYPAYSVDMQEAHTDGMAELLSHATGEDYDYIREMITIG
jgi:hypothetical protein